MTLRELTETLRRLMHDGNTDLSAPVVVQVDTNLDPDGPLDLVGPVEVWHDGRQEKVLIHAR